MKRFGQLAKDTGLSSELFIQKAQAKTEVETFDLKGMRERTQDAGFARVSQNFPVNRRRKPVTRVRSDPFRTLSQVAKARDPKGKNVEIPAGALYFVHLVMIL